MGWQKVLWSRLPSSDAAPLRAASKPPWACRRCEGVAGSASELTEARAAGLPLRAVVHLRRAQGGPEPNPNPAAPSAAGAPAQPAAAPGAKAGTEVAFGSAAKAAPVGKGAAKGTGKQAAVAAAPTVAVAMDPVVLMAGAAAILLQLWGKSVLGSVCVCKRALSVHGDDGNAIARQSFGRLRQQRTSGRRWAISRWLTFPLAPRAHSSLYPLASPRLPHLGHQRLLPPRQQPCQATRLPQRRPRQLPRLRRRPQRSQPQGRRPARRAPQPCCSTGARSDDRNGRTGAPPHGKAGAGGKGAPQEKREKRSSVVAAAAAADTAPPLPPPPPEGARELLAALQTVLEQVLDVCCMNLTALPLGGFLMAHDAVLLLSWMHTLGLLIKVGHFKQYMELRAPTQASGDMLPLTTSMS